MPSVLITGANRGLGLEFVRQYLADGWQVYAACRDPDSASELRRLAEDSGETLRILAMDVTDPAWGQRSPASSSITTVANTPGRCWGSADDKQLGARTLPSFILHLGQHLL